MLIERRLCRFEEKVLLFNTTKKSGEYLKTIEKLSESKKSGNYFGGEKVETRV